MKPKTALKRRKRGISHVAHWLTLCAPNARGLGFDPRSGN